MTTAIWAHREVHEAVQAVVETLGNKQAALDAASGPGALTDWLAKRCDYVVGVDLGREDGARPGVVGDLDDGLPFGDASFDLIVSVETIEHLENPHRFLREIGRVLRKGGYVVLSTPNVHSFVSRMKYAVLGLPSMFDFVSKDAYGQHISPVSIGIVLQAFDRAGVSLERVDSVGQSPWIRRPLNVVLWIFLGVLRRSRRFPADHYVMRLTPADLRRLNDEASLIVVGRKTH